MSKRFAQFDPIALERAVARDELAEIAAMEECACTPTMMTRVAVQEWFSPRFDIFRCCVCKKVIPARHIDAGTCDVRPAELNA